MASAAEPRAYEKRKAHFTYLWKIEFAPRRTNLKSPVFTVPSMEMTKWKLIMKIDWLQNGISMDTWIERNEEDEGPESIEVDFELAFLDTSGSSLIQKSGSRYFRKTTKSERNLFPGDALWNKRGDCVFPKDPLTIRCRLWRRGTKISQSELCFASTRFDTCRASFVWPIKRFKDLRLEEKRKRVVDFGCEQLILSFSLDQMMYDDIFAFIHLETHTLKNPFHICSEIALLNDDGVVSRKYQNYISIDTDERYDLKLSLFEERWICLLLFDDLILRWDLLLISELTLWSRIDDYKFMDYPNSIIDQNEKRTNFDEITEAVVCPFKEIVNSFKEEGTLSDVSLRAGTKSFPVHKLILSSRSPVFRAMFTEDMREKTSKCIDIPDMEADTLGRLLSYIYQDTLQLQELTWEKAVNLYEAADEYAVLDLKEKCSIFLKSNLSESNVCKILVISDLHQDESLKKSVQQFMQNNREIMHSEIWKVFKAEHSKLALETAEQIIFNMNPPRS